MMLNFFLPLVTLIAGCVFTWIIRRLAFEKSFVTADKWHSLQAEFNALKIDKAVADNAFTTCKEESNKLALSCEAKTEELRTLSRELAERTTEKEHLELDILSLKADMNTLQLTLDKRTQEVQGLQTTNSNLQAQLRFQQEKLNTQKDEMDNLGKKFEDAFSVLAQKILENKSQAFSQEQEKNLKNILTPLQKEIQLFKEDIDTKHRSESEERISLREQVRHMSTLNQTLSEQANKLTETLRLQVKQQGDWGESILEAILENSGLQKDLQYKTQHSAKNDDGKTIRPDIVVNYPDGRKIIIDSKVSLVSYYNMCNAQNGEEEKAHAKDLVKSLKSHIDGLSAKNYSDISQTLDFVILFVPVEPAYIAAMHNEPELWQYAYKKGIFLISPANLITTLKLVKDMWRKDAVDKNAQEIADKAGKLYDKLVGFVETFERVGTQLEKATETWGDARKQLTAGKGNLISQALKMQALKISSKKELPEALGNEAILNDRFYLDRNRDSDIPLYE
ncbi:DNA recombination protein RmuC [Flavisolibacter sp. BT320]|nr:DNA recombination protein RmuC [Flavisolibacter longurius]